MHQNNTISSLLSSQVEKTSDRMALSFRGQTLSYKELDRLSNQLANFLIGKGIGREDLVPICLNRSFEMIISILGVIKSGAAYVPIDPKYPTERINYIVAQTNCKIVIAQESFMDRFYNEALLIDGNESEWKNAPSDLPKLVSEPHDLLYVIYTSGSTGRPKGVMVEHRSLANYIVAQQSYFNITEEDRILQFSNYCFDASVEQIFLTITSGACLVIINEEELKDIDSFSEMLKEEKISHLHATPAFLDNLEAVEYPALKRIVSAGDVCSKELVRKWVDKTDFYNKYGPTEATISILEYKCEVKDIDLYPTIPIGKAIAGVDVYLLDDLLNEVDTGSEGQIYAGGIQVSRGYLNEPELTLESFIPSPFEKGGKLYKTGDYGRKSADGTVEYIGRADDQVKIRGFRVELKEIESKLREAPAVAQCSVIALDEGGLGKKLIAYVVMKDKVDHGALKQFLLASVPEYMVPQLFVELDSLPLNSNGKVDKKALPHPDESRMGNSEFNEAKYDTEKTLLGIWQQLLSLSKIDVSENFFELGGNSLLAQKMVSQLKVQGIKLSVTKVYSHPTISGLAAFIDGRPAPGSQKKNSSLPKVRKLGFGKDDIAIIGMACRVPGADDIHTFWENIKAGAESIHFFSDEELDPSIHPSIKSNPNYVKARGIINEPAAFDPAFFGINPKLATLMDPQQRVFLEIAWEALEHSGQVPLHFDGTIGVYCGCRFNTYYTHNVISNGALIADVGPFLVGTVNDKDYMASRTAYSLDLKGPAVNVQSACSTSLLAIAEAAESIKNGHCDVALAGGSSMLVPVNSGHLYEEGAMLSHDGHCRAFDAEARGTVFSDGAGVVVLKSREAAERDGDVIYALIKGVGLSNDGGAKGSFTAPSASGQAAAITMAMEDAEISGEQITYIETHGTATPLGDPIEIEGLNIAFGEVQNRQYCAIGSVKSNIGHLTSASGVIGLIKTSLSLYHKLIPPSINYTVPNPHIDFANSPFYVNTTLVPWENEQKRIAGVSSFGVGGTNVHLLLEEAETVTVESSPGRPMEIICWSSKTEESLNNYREKLSRYTLESGADLADIAYTLTSTRQDFNVRGFVVANDNKQLVARLETPVTATKGKAKPISSEELVFMFPGQGAQFLHMGKDLYDAEPVFRDSMNECAALLQDELGENILEVIYPEVLDEAAEHKLKNTRYSQPALFSIGYSLGKLWMSWDVFPTAMVGHSIGEFVAAYFAGVFSLPDALKLIAARGKMMAGLTEGHMLSVRADEKVVQSFLSEEVSLAAVNSPSLSVLSGSVAAIAELSKRLDATEIPHRLLPTSHAFHSHMMDEVVEPFRKLVASIVLNEPVIPILSTVTGDWLTRNEAIDPFYWANHLRSTVYFGNAIEKLLVEHFKIFVELGPGNSATVLARQQAAGRPVTIVSSLGKNSEPLPSYHAILNALGELWVNGITPNWKAFYREQKRRRLNDLPTYAFDNKNYWVNASGPEHSSINLIPTAVPLLSAAPGIKHPTKMRKQLLITQIKEILENASGIDMNVVTPDMTFLEAGLDSLLLTQVALTLKKKFSVPVTFRQLNDEFGTLDTLAGHLDEQLPKEAFLEQDSGSANSAPHQAQPNLAQYAVPNYNIAPNNGGNTALDLIGQQLQLLARQLTLIQGGAVQQVPVEQPSVQQSYAPVANPPEPQLSPEEVLEIKKPFGAAAKIEKQSAALTEIQQNFLTDLIKKYNNKTKASKEYTQKHRAYMADPRVVSGFRPSTKELVYSIVINKSKGSRLWDVDGNEYIDALNGFGSNMLGYQPDFIKAALIDQIEKGYEIGPQHELSGEVSKLICEFTKFDRAALCNTGSEAVLGAMRIARTVTGRSLIVAFSGSYHGIADEVIVRGSKKLKTFPAAPGIMPEAVQNMLILDYGSEEALRIIEERADEIAAVLVEPVQSRRCDFQPLEFLKKLRILTEQEGMVLIFDEVISGFRFHPGGVQTMFGIQADLGTYGKVAGGGISIGIIAGKKQFMDALDGGFWQFGDSSIPEVGVTYFAGTFVRHPLALATAKASLSYLKEAGPQLQENLNANGTFIANKLNSICRKLRVPIFIAQFGSLWRIRFLEDYAYNELFFTLMRYKGIHILEGFSCFLTTAHTTEDILQIIKCFEESLLELKAVDLIPEFDHGDVENPELINLNVPPLPNARLGKDKDGNPGWFVEDTANPGKFLQVTL